MDKELVGKSQLRVVINGCVQVEVCNELYPSRVSLRSSTL